MPVEPVLSSWSQPEWTRQTHDMNNENMNSNKKQTEKI